MDGRTTDKAALRRLLRAAWAALSPGWMTCADRAIADRLWWLPEMRAADSIFCYVSTPGEIDTRAILTRALAEGRTVAVPLVTGTGVMEARCLEGLYQLRPGAFGLSEPPPEAPLLPKERLSLCLLPCLSSNSSGARLGKGGGYYDRFLRDRRFVTVALCYQQLLREDIPMAPHDQAVDLVVTERGVFRARDADR